MKAGTMILAGGIAVATLAGAAPAAAQYYQGYPGYGSQGYPGYGNPGYPGYGVPNGYGYGANQQAAVNQCAAAVQQRLNGYNGARGYGYNGYQNGYGGARVLGISRVEPRSGGGLDLPTRQARPAEQRGDRAERLRLPAAEVERVVLLDDLDVLVAVFVGAFRWEA